MYPNPSPHALWCFLCAWCAGTTERGVGPGVHSVTSALVHNLSISTTNLHLYRILYKSRFVVHRHIVYECQGNRRRAYRAPSEGYTHTCTDTTEHSVCMVEGGRRAVYRAVERVLLTSCVSRVLCTRGQKAVYRVVYTRD